MQLDNQTVRHFGRSSAYLLLQTASGVITGETETTECAGDSERYLRSPKPGSGGLLWIMPHLNHQMMPMDQLMLMQRQDL
jgi:hypothetical protein